MAFHQPTHLLWDLGKHLPYSRSASLSLIEKKNGSSLTDEQLQFELIPTNVNNFAALLQQSRFGHRIEVGSAFIVDAFTRFIC